MSEDTTKKPNPSDVQFFDRLESLLEKLVPPDSVTIQNCKGESIEIPGSIPARRQIKVFRMMRDLMEIAIVSDALSNMSSVELPEILDALITISTEMEVAEKIGEIFSTAYPFACGDEDPLDLFAIEEMVTSLVPFSERFIRRLGGGMNVLAKGAMDLQQ